MDEILPNWLSLLPSFGIIAILSIATFGARKKWKEQHQFNIREWLPVVPACLLLFALTILALVGWLDASVGWIHLSAASLCLTLCGIIPLFRDSVFKMFDEMPRRQSVVFRAIFALVVAVVVSVVCAWAIDYAWLEDNGSIEVQYFAVSAIVFFLLCAILFFIGQQTGTAMILVPLLACGFGIAQHFVVNFKGAPIMPTDLLTLDTAGAVVGGYQFIINERIANVILVAGICITLLMFLKPCRPETRRGRVVSIALNSSLGVILAVLMSSAFCGIRLDQVIRYSYDRWMPLTTYQELGFVPAFIEVAQDLAIPVPDGYNAGEAQELMDDLVSQYEASLGVDPARQEAVAQFEQLKPTVIAVMNEAFTDLSTYDRLMAAGYSGLQSYNNLSGALQRGTLMVPVFGGGTSNSEFEFLTGNSLAFVGADKYPYQLYDLSKTENLARQFGGLGYETTAIHPQNPDNWKRSSAYRQMGFEEFLSIDDFRDAPVYHAGATDASTYNMILKLLEDDECPQFIFDVTMQNHGGYAEGSVPEEDMVMLNVPDVTDPAHLSELGVYLACVQRSEMDLLAFLEQLEMLDRPVILVFFGDHQPGLTALINNELVDDQAPVARLFQKCESTYLMWSNYDVAGMSEGNWKETGSSQLAAQLMYCIGAPLTDRQKADLVLGEEIPSLSSAGYRGSDGQRYALGADSPYQESLWKMSAIQYLTFGSEIK